jgi:hypothetical protein
MDYVIFLQNQIVTQKQDIKSFKIWIIGTILLGVAIILLSFALPATGSDWIKLGGGFLIALVSGFVYSYIPPRRERIIAYTAIIQCFEDCKDQPPESREVCVRFADEALKICLGRPSK